MGAHFTVLGLLPGLLRVCGISRRSTFYSLSRHALRGCVHISRMFCSFSLPSEEFPKRREQASKGS